MPVSLPIVNHEAKNWEHPRVTTPEDLFEQACPKQFRKSERIIQSSFSRSQLRERYTSPSENGFVWAAYYAYSTHHHLTIRPEDVWFAILTQLSFYINANAEKLRSFFVAHEGQKELEVVDGGSLEYANFGALAERMTELIAKNVNDPELRTWVMPSFSTTDHTDRVVASVLFMGAMQKYFSYTMTLACGIPSVTLLGELSDWKEILARLDKLEQLGDEPTQFAEMLRPILRHFILSFEEPTHPDVNAFWNTLASHNHIGSGTDYISGWMSAFCFWDEDGNCKTRFRDQVVLDGVPYPTIDIDKVPVGVASVPVTVNDNGDIFECTMMAGSFGIQASPFNDQSILSEAPATPESSSNEAESPPATSIRPLSGWLMYENESEQVVEQRRQEIQKLEDELRRSQEASKSTPAKLDRESLFQKMNLWNRINELKSY